MKFSIRDFFSRVSCGFGYIYWRRRNGKLYFLCGDIGYVYIISHVYRVFRIFQSTLIYASTKHDFPLEELLLKLLEKLYCKLLK